MLVPNLYLLDIKGLYDELEKVSFKQQVNYNFRYLPNVRER